MDRDRIESLLRKATFWLTPGTTKDYRAEDFDFLSTEEQRLLAEGVAEFDEVARSVPPKAPATDDQLNQGVTGFRKVLEVIRPDKYPDFEAFLIGKKIERQAHDELPDWVRELVFVTGLDHYDNPSLSIWVEGEDFALKSEVLGENAELVREILRRAAHEVCPDRWPLVSFRTVSEQRSSLQMTSP